MKRAEASPSRFWAEPAEGVLAALETLATGLSTEEADRRLAAVGVNELAHAGRRHASAILLAQVANPLVLVLVGAAVVSHFLGERLEALVILAIVVLNAALAFFQEYRAERALRELRLLVSHDARVLRDGREVELPARRLVPGDVVRLAIGDVVPADLRLLAADDLSTDESTLTGESLPAAKDPAPVPAGRTQPHELACVAFAGTTVESGYATGVVYATAGGTFLGRTAGLIEKKPRETDFQRSIRRFSDLLLVIILGMTAFVFAANALLGKGLFDSFLFALALAVGITPEALPVIITITLSNGALRMARDKVVTKRLMSVEDLGNIDTLCCDKTGTLTVGELAFAGAVDADGRPVPALVADGLLCSSGSATTAAATSLNAVDKALWAHAAETGAARGLDAWRVLDRNELDFERRRTSALVAGPGGNRLVVKGAPESVLAVAASVARDGRLEPLDAAAEAAIRTRVHALENAGHRVLAVADRPLAASDSEKRDETDLVLRGFLLFLDPPKPTARASLKRLRELGVALKVISGDSPVVTRRIAIEVGLATPDTRVVTGDELEGLDEKALLATALAVSLFARVTPEQKYRLVASLSTEGHIVGFLGDGVNDAPALRAADVGIAVDGGTGIAKEAADIILLEKSLAVLAQGIVEGRKTFGNISKYVFNTVSANFGNMTTVAASSLFLRFIPLLPSQILLNNFLSDLPLLTIATDRVDADWLRRPRRWRLDLIVRFMLWFGVLSALFDLVLILTLVHLFAASTDLFRTAWFVESACSEMIVTFAIRTRLPFWRSRPSGWLLGATAAAGALVLLLPYTRPGRLLFAFVALPSGVFWLVVGILAAYLAAAEAAKRWFFRRYEV